MAWYEGENIIDVVFDARNGEGKMVIQDEKRKATVWFLLTKAGNGSIFISEETLEKGPVYISTRGGEASIRDWGRNADIDKILAAQK